MSEVFDFGFTLVDENELQVVQELKTVEEKTDVDMQQLQDKVDSLYNAITPLLNNLKANPEKEYILWPNRVEKVEQFESHLQTIYAK